MTDPGDSDKKFDIYPMSIPKPADPDNVQPIGINRKISQSWNGSSSHLIQFSDKGDTYGRPPEGSLTEERAKRASQHINNEVIVLISVIRGIGEENPDTPGLHTVTFGRLFEYYTRISNKVAGILLRARRWNLVDFKGEMLYQGQDNKTLIKTLVTADQVPTIREYSADTSPKPEKPKSLKDKLKTINQNTQ